MWLTESLRLGINIFLFFCDVSRRQRRSFQLFTEFMISDCLRIYLFQISFENPTFFSSSALFGSSAVAATTVVVGCYFLLFFAYSFLHCNLRFFCCSLLYFFYCYSIWAHRTNRKNCIYSNWLFFFVSFAEHTRRAVCTGCCELFFLFIGVCKKRAATDQCVYIHSPSIYAKKYTQSERMHICALCLCHWALSHSLSVTVIYAAVAANVPPPLSSL